MSVAIHWTSRARERVRGPGTKSPDKVLEVGVSVSKWFRVAIGVLLVCLISTPAIAQQTAPPPTPGADQGDVEPKTNISFGYAFMHDSSWDEYYYLGWVATLSHRIKPNLARRTLTVAGSASGASSSVLPALHSSCSPYSCFKR